MVLVCLAINGYPGIEDIFRLELLALLVSYAVQGLTTYSGDTVVRIAAESECPFETSLLQETGEIANP